MQYCIWWAGATNSTTSSSQVSLRILLFRHFFLTRWLVLFKLQPKDLTLFCSPAYYKQNWLASDYAFQFHWRQWLIFGWLRWASEYTRISNNGQLVKKLNALHHQPGNLPLPACSLNCKAQPRWTKQGLHCTSKELCLLFSYSFPPFYILTQVNKHEDIYTPFLWVLLCTKQIIGLKHQDLHKHGEQAVSQEQQQHRHCPHQPRHSATAPKQGHPNSSDQFCWQSHTVWGKSGVKPI